MKYSRIFSISHQTSDSSLKSAAPDSNQDDLHLSLFDQLRSVFHTHSRRQFGLFDAEVEENKFRDLIASYSQQSITAPELAEQLADAFKFALAVLEQDCHCYLWLVLDNSSEEEFLYAFLLDQDDA
ncbi:MAG TPA: hypothetical protein VFM46_09145, partial [Pseudomonadales bacterium]|nr:hypothetical protein [Pseudomonadales bacterium]